MSEDFEQFMAKEYGATFVDVTSNVADGLRTCGGCGCARYYHIVSDETLEGYCDFFACACTKFEEEKSE